MKFKSVEGGTVPLRQTKFSAGFDLSCRYNAIVKPFETKVLSAGIVVDFEGKTDIFGLISIRSSFAIKGLSLANGVGVIDPDFKEEIGLIVKNNTKVDFFIKKSERIAQILFVPFFIFGDISEKIRKGGLGSTGGGGK